jgi:hypothetical protein
MNKPDFDINLKKLFSRQRALVCIVVLTLITPALTSTVLAATGTVFVGAGTPIVTASGVEIKPATGQQFNLQSPFVSKNAVKLKNVTFSGSDSSATVDQFGDPATGGQETELSNVDVTSGPLIVNRTKGTPNVGVTGSVTGFDVRNSNLSAANTSIDLNASAQGGWQIRVQKTGLAAGKGVVAEDSSGSPLGAGSVEPDGSVKIENLPPVTNANINLQVGASELLVFKESSPSERVDNATLRVRFFSTGQVVERTVTNGEVDLTGVPPDERIAITVKNTAGSNQTGLVYRRITIPSITEQEEIYLLNASETDAAPVNFNIDDRSGEFPPGETRFIIQKSIRKDYDNDGSNETRFQRISGDILGNSRNFPAILEKDQRYRLRAVNNDGDTRELGAYTVRGPSNPTIQIGRIELSTEDSEAGYAVDFRLIREDFNGDGTEDLVGKVIFRDSKDRMRNLVYEVANEDRTQSGSKPAGTTVSGSGNIVTGPLGTHTFSFIIPPGNNDPDDTYRLNWSAERPAANGTVKQISGNRFAGGIPEIAGRLPVDPRWLELIGFVSIVAVAGLIVIIDPAVASIATTGWASLLTLLGVVAIPAPALGLAGAVSVTAIVGRVR